MQSPWNVVVELLKQRALQYSWASSYMLKVCVEFTGVEHYHKWFFSSFFFIYKRHKRHHTISNTSTRRIYMQWKITSSLTILQPEATQKAEYLSAIYDGPFFGTRFDVCFRVCVWVSSERSHDLKTILYKLELLLVHQPILLRELNITRYKH